jgi:hypothetical protein
MPLSATGSFAVVVNGAAQVLQGVRDVFAERTNAFAAFRLAKITSGGGTASTAPPNTPWDVSSALEWFNLTTVSANASLLQGALFDGRRIYWVPYGAPAIPGGTASPWMAVYDTTLPFGSTTSYQVVSLITESGSSAAQGFLGGAIDPQGFLYFAPQAGKYPYTSGVVLRFDTSKLVTDTTAYSTFDVTQVTTGGVTACSGYASACCDGRWVYFCPTQRGMYPSSLVPHGSAVRYDTTKTFSDTHSWEVIDMTTVFSGLFGMQSVQSDGAFVYYAPFASYYLARYEIDGSFTSSGAWASFDMRTIMPQADVGPTGITQVGRYLFFNPWKQGSTPVSIIARYDTLAPGGLTSVASWATFDLSTLPTSSAAQGYQGSLTDGLYLYMIPADNGSGVPPFLRYDSRKDLSDSAAWTEIAGTPSPSSSAILSTGGAMDGIYGYNCPYSHLLSGSGWVYRWKLWPGQPDAPQRLGASRSFWQDSSSRFGFGTQAPAEQVHAVANVRADGALVGQLGTSGKIAPAVTSATISTAVASNVTPNETPLVTYLLPPSALVTYPRGVRITAYGSYAANTDVAKVVRLYFGTAPVVALTVPLNGGAWYLDATVLRQSHNLQQGGGVIVAGTYVASGATQISATEANSITIEVAGNGAHSGDVSLGGFLVDFLNVNANP